MRNLIIVISSILIFNVSDSFSAVMYEGIEFPNGGSSFADEVVDYSPGSYVVSPYTDPSHALGE